MKTTRRDFIKTTALVTAATLAPRIAGAAPGPGYDPKGLPTTVLGRTGIRVPRMAIGTGSRFMSIQSDDDAIEVMNTALDSGFYYWDTADSYGSQKRLGQILKSRRNEVFLASKTGTRELEAAKRNLEQTLTDLQTDHLDLYQIHSVTGVDDVRSWETSGLYEQMVKWKDEGVTRCIGFTGHSSATAMRLAATIYDFDTMLIALNHQNPSQGFEENAVPAAACKGMGVMVIKVIRPRENDPSLKVEDLIRYGLSLEHVHVNVIGTDSLEVVNSNAEILRNFTPMSPTELDTMHVALAPFYRHENVPWMKPGYVDGASSSSIVV